VGIAEVLSKVFDDKKEEKLSKLPGVPSLLFSFTKTESVPPPTIDTVYRASQIDRLCPRQEVICALKRITRSNKIPGEMYFVMNVGTAVHEVVRRMLTPFGVLYGQWKCENCGAIFNDLASTGFCTKCHEYSLVYVEKKFQMGYISGHPDGFLMYNKKKMLLEIKSTEAVADLKGPKSNHKTQRNIYCFLTGINRCCMLYLKRSKLFPVEFIVDYDEEVVKKAYDKVAIIKNGIKEKKLPVGVCKRKRDKYCEVKEICEIGL